MITPDVLGYAASALVLATFCMRGMVALRVTAIASNVAFIAYGASASIDPVLLLHVLLLPLNALRLAQESKAPLQRDATAPASPAVAAATAPTACPEAHRHGRGLAALVGSPRNLESPACLPSNKKTATAKLRSTS